MKRDRFNVFMVRFAVGFVIAFSSGPNAPSADFPQGLVLQFNFDQMENNGMVIDRSGHGNARVLGAKWIPYGKQGSGCDFFTTNSCLVVANNTSLNLTQATFAVWFKVLKQGSYDRFILDKGIENGFAFGIGGETNDSRLGFAVSNNICVGDGPVTDGQWHHGAATYDGENMKLYVDGKLQKQVILWRGEIPANTNDLVIGISRSNQATREKKQSFDGMLDDLMIFNHALSEAEIQVVIASVKPKFTREQVAQRLKELKELYDRGLILKDFYDRKVKECEVSP